MRLGTANKTLERIGHNSGLPLNSMLCLERNRMLNKLAKQFEALSTERQKEAQDHENACSWEMSFIAYWSILEDGLKLFAPLGVREQLHTKIKEWDAFLSGKKDQKPKDIRNFSVEHKTDKIPPIQTIEIILGEMPKVAEVIEPKKKWRNRRNEIAHKASKFKNEALFTEYKNDVLMAVDELNTNITNACTRIK